MRFISFWLKNQITGWLWECIWPNVELNVKKYMESAVGAHKELLEENVAFMRESREQSRDDYKHSERRHDELIAVLKDLKAK